jgi:addiction module HigA family antidote
MAMKNPPHPGELVKQECIEALEMSVTDAADALGVTRQALSNLINGQSGISPEMAIRLEKAFGGTAEGWLKLQLAHDLATARKNIARIKVRRVAAYGRKTA